MLRLAAAGFPSKAITPELSLSPRKIQLHLAHIFERMAVASRTAACESRT